MYENSSILDDLKREFRKGNMITRLIYMNVGVFVLINVVHLVLFLLQSKGLFPTVLEWLMVPAEPKTLLTRPWTLISYMFLHEGFLHILFNMLYLYWFGKIFTLFMSEDKVLPLYIFGGLAGALLFIITFNLFPALKGQVSDAYMLGASAAVLAIVIAAATAQPNYSIYLFFFGAVKIKYIAMVVVLIDVFSIPKEINVGGHIAHLGGAMMGYVYIKQLYKGNDWSKGFNSLMNSVAEAFKFRSSKPKVIHRSESVITERWPKRKRKSESKSRQEKLDEILDKISKSGYDSLSEEEKAFLFKVSKDSE